MWRDTYRDDTHRVYHYRWPNWPDRSSPRSGAPLVALITKLKALQEKGPVTVHCSAGIGRTGTLCAVDYAIDRLNEEGTVSPTDVSSWKCYLKNTNVVNFLKRKGKLYFLKNFKII